MAPGPPERDRDAEGRPRNARPRDRTGRPLPRGAVDQMPDRVEPDDVARSVDDALARAVALAAEGRCFEAHEFLEWIWKSSDVARADRDFWKGVTQLVVAGVHLQRGNAEGAARLATRGLRFLAPYPEGHAGVDTVTLRDDGRRVMAALAESGDTRGVALPRLRLLA